MCELKHDVDPAERSAEFARLVRKAEKATKMSSQALSQWSGVPLDRLAEIEKGETVVTSVELQLLTLALGIGMDQLFPLDHVSDPDIHAIFGSLVSGKNKVGLMAAAAAPHAESLSCDSIETQRNYERSVVQLHHCAECLGRFPRGEL